MIWPMDALRLSATKLKNRRIRLIVTVVVAGLLFVGLAFVSIIFNGFVSSVENFSQDGFGKRFIVNVSDAGYNDIYKVLSQPEVVAKAKQADSELVAAKTAEAKRLGIPYDKNGETLAVSEQSKDPSGQLVVQETPQTAALIRDENIKLSAPYFTALNTAEKNFKPIARYQLIPLNNYFGNGGLNMPSIGLMQDGKEADSAGQEDNFYGPPTGLKSISSGLSAVDAELLKTFALPNQTMDISSDGAIPIIAPFSAAEEVLGLSKLPDNASSGQKLDRVKQVREQIAGKTFQICVRNRVSLDRQTEAEGQAKMIEQGQNDKNFVMPELVMRKSDKPCEDVVVTRDVRNADTKAFDAKQAEFDAKFGKPAPSQRIVSFKIAGIVSDPPGFGGFSIKDIVTSMLATNLGSGWFIPTEARTGLPEFEQLFADAEVINNYTNNVLFEFASVADARNFTDNQSCRVSGMIFDPEEYSNACRSAGTPFMINSFGSNSIALDSAKRTFTTIFRNVGLVVSVISLIIMMGTVGKVIADSRRETAVFRAIGAKRLDIAQIYVVYAILLSLIVAIFAIGLATLIAFIVSTRFAEDVTVEALIIFNSTDLSRKFSLIGFNWVQITVLIGFIVGAGLISAIGPLIANLRRNPIKDMRDER